MENVTASDEESLAPAASSTEPVSPATVPDTPEAVAISSSEYPSTGSAFATVRVSVTVPLPTCTITFDGGVIWALARR